MFPRVTALISSRHAENQSVHLLSTFSQGLKSVLPSPEERKAIAISCSKLPKSVLIRISDSV